MNCHHGANNMLPRWKVWTSGNQREKGRDLTQSYVKSLYTNRKVIKSKVTTENATKKLDNTTIANRLRVVSWISWMQSSSMWLTGLRTEHSQYWRNYEKTLKWHIFDELILGRLWIVFLLFCSLFRPNIEIYFTLCGLCCRQGHLRFTNTSCWWFFMLW